MESENDFLIRELNLNIPFFHLLKKGKMKVKTISYPSIPANILEASIKSATKFKTLYP